MQSCNYWEKNKKKKTYICVIPEAAFQVATFMQGELTITADMENLQTALFFNNVPDSWTKRAYPSMNGLSAWYADLLLRIRDLENWVSDFNMPSCIWLAGFFNPQSFLTAIMQSMARKNEWPLDKMCLQCDVTKKNKDDFSSPPREGAYIHGLFMEGARSVLICYYNFVCHTQKSTLKYV